ncbi:MAG: ribonuclease Z, partial [Pirellulaceae bacterium]
SLDWSPLNPINADAQPLTMSIGGGGTLSYFPLKHPGGALGYRLDWPDRSLAYVTDTTAVEDAAYIEHIRGVDVLLHECYFPDGWEDRAELTGHSCISPVAKIAAAADVGRLILVHINPLAMEADPFGLDRARKIFANIEIGTDGQIVDF